MYKFWMIKFTRTGAQAIMRTRVSGGHGVALMDAEGNFITVDAISEPFESYDIQDVLNNHSISYRD